MLFETFHLPMSPAVDDHGDLWTIDEWWSKVKSMVLISQYEARRAAENETRRERKQHL